MAAVQSDSNTFADNGNAIDALAAALAPIIERVRTDVTAIKTPDGSRWTRETLTDDRLREHLAGGTPRGCCPIRAGESTVRLALFDLDSHKGETPWPTMVEVARRLIDTAELFGLELHAFRSSGGAGLHLFAIWDEPQDAHSVREALREVLDAAGLVEGTRGVRAGEVEIFPKQDFVPADGFGNQFILPLAGRSVPLDPDSLAPMEREAATCIVWRVSEPVERRTAPPKADTTTGAPEPLERIRAALESIPNTEQDGPDYDRWRDLCFAVHEASAGSDEALDAFITWSAQNPRHDEKFLRERVWPYIREGNITRGTLFATAAAHGWIDTTDINAEGFEDVSDEDLIQIRAMLTAAIEKARRPAFRIFGYDDLMALPPLEWVVKGVMPSTGLASIYGASQAGKTFIALDMAAAIARGEPWFEFRTKVRPVVYIVLEGEAGIQKRIKAWSRQNDCRLPDNMGIVTDRFVLSTDSEMGGGKEEIERYARTIVEAFGEGAVVFIDTLNRAAPAADENSSRDMGRILEAAKILQRMTKGLIVMVHHVGKNADAGPRGHSSFYAALDAAIEVRRDLKTNTREWSIAKSKDGEDGGAQFFHLKSFIVGTDEDGEPIRSCAVEQGLGPNGSTAVEDPARKLKGGHRRVHDAVIECAAEHGNIHGLHVAVELGVCRKKFYESERAAGSEAKDNSLLQAFGRGIDRMIEKGIIKVEGETCFIDADNTQLLLARSF